MFMLLYEIETTFTPSFALNAHGTDYGIKTDTYML